MKNSLFVFLLLFSSILNVNASNLEEFLISTYESDLLKQEKIKHENIKTDIFANSTNLLPSISADVGFYQSTLVGSNSISMNGGSGLVLGNTYVPTNSSSNLTTYGVTLAQNISIYKIIPGLIYLKNLYDKNEIEYKILLQNFGLATISLYMNIISTEKAIDIYNQKHKLLKKELEAAKIKQKYKIFDSKKIALIEATISEINAKIIELKANLKNDCNEYFLLSNKQCGKFTEPELKTLAYNSKEEYLEVVKSQNVVLNILKYNLKIANSQVNASIANILPDIYAVFGYKHFSVKASGLSAMFNSIYGGVTGSFTLNSPNNNIVNSYKATKNKEVSIIQSRVQESRTISEAEKTWDFYFSLLDLQRASKLKISALQASVDEMKIKMSYGTSNLIEYLRTEDQLLQSELANIEIEKNLVMTYYKILSLSGTVKFI